MVDLEVADVKVCGSQRHPCWKGMCCIPTAWPHNVPGRAPEGSGIAGQLILWSSGQNAFVWSVEVIKDIQKNLQPSQVQQSKGALLEAYSSPQWSGDVTIDPSQGSLPSFYNRTEGLSRLFYAMELGFEEDLAPKLKRLPGL